jgi:acyl-CoA thioester hydrolase
MALLQPRRIPVRTAAMLAYHTPILTEDLRALGIPAPWTFGLADRVRFGELDALGHVNNTAYLRWFESFRLPYLKARQVTDYGPGAPRLVLRSASAEYKVEMGMDLDYVVVGRARAYRRTSFTMEFAVYTLDPAQVTATGEAVVVLLNRDAPGRFPIPEAGIAAFRDHDGAVAEG